MNVHTPERQAGESRDAYKARRQQSKSINARNGKPEGWQPETRKTGSEFASPALESLLTGAPLPRLKKRKSRKVARSAT